MKKLIIAFIALLLASVAFLFLRGDYRLLSSSFESVVVTTALFSFVISFLTEGAKKMFVGVKGLGVQVISLVIALFLCFILWFLSKPFGLTTSPFLYLIYAFILSFTANGFYSTGVVTWLLGLFRGH